MSVGMTRWLKICASEQNGFSLIYIPHIFRYFSQTPLLSLERPNIREEEDIAMRRKIRTGRPIPLKVSPMENR